MPRVLGVGRAEQRHVCAASRPRWGVPAVRAGAGRAIPVRALPRLPVPAAVVLDLPGPRVAGAPADDRAHRQVGTGRPGAGAGQAESAARVGPVDLPVQVGQRIAQTPALPSSLGQPVVLGPQHVEVIEGIGGGAGRARQAAAQERRHRLDRHRRGAGVGQPHPAAQRALAGQHAVEHLRPQSADRVGQVDSQLAPAPGQLAPVVTQVAEPSAGLSIRSSGLPTRPFPRRPGPRRAAVARRRRSGAAPGGSSLAAPPDGSSRAAVSSGDDSLTARADGSWAAMPSGDDSSAVQACRPGSPPAARARGSGACRAESRMILAIPSAPTSIRRSRASSSTSINGSAALAKRASSLPCPGHPHITRVKS